MSDDDRELWSAINALQQTTTALVERDALRAEQIKTMMAEFREHAGQGQIQYQGMRDEITAQHDKLRRHMDEALQNLSNVMVSKDSFRPIFWIVWGLAAGVGTGFLGAVVAMVLPRAAT